MALHLKSYWQIFHEKKVLLWTYSFLLHSYPQTDVDVILCIFSAFYMKCFFHYLLSKKIIYFLYKCMQYSCTFMHDSTCMRSYDCNSKKFTFCDAYINKVLYKKHSNIMRPKFIITKIPYTLYLVPLTPMESYL